MPMWQSNQHTQPPVPFAKVLFAVANVIHKLSESQFALTDGSFICFTLVALPLDLLLLLFPVIFLSSFLLFVALLLLLNILKFDR